ncbi:MAG: CoA transferase, partial [Actinomycetota bacterium]
DLLDSGGGAEFGDHASGDLDLRRELAAIFATRSRAEWVTFFLTHDVPGGPVHRGSEVRDDPQFRTRARIIEQDHPQAGRIRMLAPPVHFAGDVEKVRPAPAVGEHTVEVLRDVIGYDDDRIEMLLESGAVTDGTRR